MNMEYGIDNKIFFTPSDIIEHLYCPGFTYFINILKIPQHEEKREKVMIGRNIHEKKSKENVDYLRKRLNVKEKILEPYLISEKYHVKGIVDEIMITKDNEYIALDYKFAEFKGDLFETYKTQLQIYGLCIRDIYKAVMVRGFIVFVRSKNKLVEIPISRDDYKNLVIIINEMLEIVQIERFPKIKRNANKCIDCTYRKICV